MPRAALQYQDGKPRVDLGLLYPPLRDRLMVATARAEKRGQLYFWTYGFRTYAESGALYKAYREGRGGRAAPAGYSAHNFGLAVDFTADGDSLASNGLQPVWHSKAYDILGAALREQGLAWGGGFGDRPHANWPGFSTGAELGPLRDLWSTTKGAVGDKLAACWAYVAAHTPALPAFTWD